MVWAEDWAGCGDQFVHVFGQRAERRVHTFLHGSNLFLRPVLVRLIVDNIELGRRLTFAVRRRHRNRIAADGRSLVQRQRPGALRIKLGFALDRFWIFATRG